MTTYGLVATYLPLAARGEGRNPGLFFLVMAAAVIVARGYAGRLSDQWGRPPVAAVGAAFQASALLPLALAPGAGSLIAAGLLYGLGFGTTQPALVAWCADLVGPAERGKAMGTFFTALELGIALGAVGAGWVLREAGYGGLFLTGSAVSLLGCTLAGLRLRW
ncbi:MAG: MFS transporter [Candidatus Rokubacteria bacterium]|nr:MFS transporter [Candidatus Rokubacteria bacterium]